VDLHKRLSQIAVLTEDGEIRQHRVANDPLRMERFFAKVLPTLATVASLEEVLKALG